MGMSLLRYRSYLSPVSHALLITAYRTDDSDRLLESQPASKTASAGHTANSRIRYFLRHVRLLLPVVLVGRAFSWMSPIEQRMVAAYQSRRMAILNSLLHLVPFLGATALLVLFWTKHWVGGASDNATTLQFVAKFHELLMQASLVDILLYVIRAQALEGYVPLGVLPGAAQAPQISYLWECMQFEMPKIDISDIEKKRSTAIRAVQPLVSTTYHRVAADNLTDFGDWIVYSARNGSMIRLSTFADI